MLMLIKRFDCFDEKSIFYFLEISLSLSLSLSLDGAYFLIKFPNQLSLCSIIAKLLNALFSNIFSESLNKAIKQSRWFLQLSRKCHLIWLLRKKNYFNLMVLH